jgi:hypothetical protein
MTYSGQTKRVFLAQRLLAVLMGVTSLICTACGARPPAQTGAPISPMPTSVGESPAATAIQRYVQARVARDANRAIALSCADWEKQARIEVSSLRAEAQLEGLACRENGTSGEFTLVDCSGKILTSYNGETRALDLSRRQFRAVLVCCMQFSVHLRRDGYR